ncbi:hypothetical protein BDR06DRAFT_1008187 [Suillus hirtellus]|nr:hypothetical protein BDR06DRAFT_1008187 [Suillus hirtellus]
MNLNGSAAKEHTTKEWAYALLEAFEWIKYRVENMEVEMCRDREEVNKMCARHLDKMNDMHIVHNAALQQHQDYINKLEEDVCHKQAMIDFLTQDVEQLEKDTNRQQKDIDWFIQQSVQDDIS